MRDLFGGLAIMMGIVFLAHGLKETFLSPHGTLHYGILVFSLVLIGAGVVLLSGATPGPRQ